MALQHLRSSTANKRPLPAGMGDGQLAINTNLNSPGIFFKDSNGDLVKAGPVHVGATAPNVSPAAGGQTGNTTGELWLDTSLTPNELKTWSGSAWVSATGQEIPVSKLIDGSARQLLQTDAAGTGVEWTSNIDVPGTLDVTGAATFDSSVAVTGALTKSGSNVVTVGDSGTVTSTMILDGTIVNGDINASAAIAGTKISPDFGSQNVTTTGTATAAALIPSGSSVPTNGVYLPSSNNVAISTNGTGRLFIQSDGKILVGANSSIAAGYTTGNLQISNAGPSALTLTRWSANAFNPTIALGKSRGTSVGTYSPLLSGDILGDIQFAGDDGTDIKTVGASITAIATSNAASNVLPTALVFTTTAVSSPTERLRITSDGKLGLGTSSPASLLHAYSAGDTEIRSESTGNNALFSVKNSGGVPWILTQRNDTSNAFSLRYSGNNYFNVTTTGNVGIGTTSPSSLLHLSATGANCVQKIERTSGASFFLEAQSTNFECGTTTNSPIVVYTNNTEKARIDSSGRLLVGTSTAPSGVDTTLVLSGNSGGATNVPRILFARTNTINPGNGGDLGYLGFGNANYAGAWVAGRGDGTWSSGTSHPTRLEFSTTADGASSPTERMRIHNDSTIGMAMGNFSDTTVATNSTNGGVVVRPSGGLEVGVNSGIVQYWNRMGNDGVICQINQGGTGEGTISVSGTTVSYNGAHLSRWSQILGIDPYNKAVRPEILRGTVMSNLDEMCDWTCPTSGDCQDNEQLNKTKISDVEGDKNVAGIFQSWDDDDNTWVNDYYLAMTGDFVIRIAAGTTVERGDLLMSAGDGTAKPQDDDIIRSKTIAKVTSTIVSCTHPDGSYCVPCVLMAC